MAKTPKTTTAPTGTIAPFGLRMLPELRAKVEESAKQSGRSMNAEIVSRIESSYTLPNEPYALESQLKDIFQRIARDNEISMMNVSLVRDMLGSYVLDLFGRLSAEDRKDPRVVLMAQIAKSAIDMKGDALARATEAIMGKGDWPEGMDPKIFFDRFGRDNENASKRRREALDGDRAEKKQ